MNTLSIPDFSDLSQATQTEIFERSKSLRGIVLRQTGPVISGLQVARLKSDSVQIPFFSPEQTSSQLDILSTLSKSDFAFIEKGWTEEAISMQKVCMSASFEDHSSEPGLMKTAYFLAKFQVPCVTVQINARDLAPSQAFVDDVIVAMSHPDRASKLQSLQRVLSEFGDALATRMTLGASLFTKKKKLFTTSEDQLSEEEAFETQLLEFLNNSPSGPIVAPHNLRFHTRGGKRGILPALDIISWLSTLQDPKTWEVIEVSSVIPTISILSEALRGFVQELLTYPLSPLPLAHFPGRLSSWYGRDSKTTGYIELPLDINLRKSLTILTWMRRGASRDTWRCFLCLESPYHPKSLLVMAYAPNHDVIGVRSDPDPHTQHHRVSLMAQTSGPIEERTWMHIAFVQQWEVEGGPNEWSLFVNGRKEGLRSIEAPMNDFDEVHLVLGRGMHSGIRENAWDGQVENVKVYDRALSETEVAEDAHIRNKPKSRGWHDEHGELRAY